MKLKYIEKIQVTVELAWCQLQCRLVLFTDLYFVFLLLSFLIHSFIIQFFLQDGEKQLWYNMAKKIIEDSPAYNLVNPCEWVCKVDGKETTDCPNEEFSNLIRNGKKVVCLSLKEAVDPLAEFVKKWDGERIETLKLSQETDFQKRCRFVHFYSKVCNTVNLRI